jgi:hypothetical protein
MVMRGTVDCERIGSIASSAAIKGEIYLLSTSPDGFEGYVVMRG